MRTIIVAVLLSGVMLILLSGCGKSEPKSEKVPYLVEKGIEQIEQVQPKVITLEGKELLYLPDVSVSKNNINIRNFY